MRPTNIGGTETSDAAPNSSTGARPRRQWAPSPAISAQRFGDRSPATHRALEQPTCVAESGGRCPKGKPAAEPSALL
eukprot:scaffold9562_cov98-Isochrysis_galbana.AAC.3